MKTLVEDEHPLVTPNFIGTDAEKILVLGYWSEVIGLMRSMNSIVISHENKLAIIDQLKKELDIIDLEVNNVSAHQVQHADGSVEMNTMPKGEEVPLKSPIIDLTQPEAAPAPTNPYEVFNPKRVPATEAMQRLAGTWYSNKATQSKSKKK